MFYSVDLNFIKFICYQGLLMTLPKRLGRYSGEFGCCHSAEPPPPPPPRFFLTRALLCRRFRKSQRCWNNGGIKRTWHRCIDIFSVQMRLQITILQFAKGNKRHGLVYLFFYHARSVRFSICRIRQVLSLLTLVDVLCTKFWRLAKC